MFRFRAGNFGWLRQSVIIVMFQDIVENACSFEGCERPTVPQSGNRLSAQATRFGSAIDLQRRTRVRFVKPDG